MKMSDTIQLLNSEKAQRLFSELYGSQMVAKQQKRYLDLVNKFQTRFKPEDFCLFSSPGRTEISGNHTDHNHGKVLAGSINLDCVGVAGINGTNQIHIISETFDQDFIIDLDDLQPGPEKAGTIDLVKGLLAGFLEHGYQVGGFDAYIVSNVISAAGVSSSAAFEMLICVILDTFFNEAAMDVVTYAQIGKFAENHYWDKGSGLLDQMACAVGGLITIDFKDPLAPVVEKIPYDFGALDHSLMIVNTGKGHADLSAEYSSVPDEMKKVAEYFGKEVCAEITKDQLINQLTAVRAYAGDRAVLRALHFFEENKRVEAEVLALKENRFYDFLAQITDSGNSSWKWLQNCYTNADYQEQGITIALALTELFIKEKKKGACRVHGGGFAGVIMAMLPNDLVSEYLTCMEDAIGEGNVYRMSIRPYGAICINALL